VVRGSPHAFQKKKQCKNSMTLTNEKYIHTCLIKLPLFAELQQKIGELFLSITSCPTIIVLDNVLNKCIEKVWL
jgi:hypothetical protein